MCMPCCVCFHFLSGQDSVRTRRWLIKKYPPAHRRHQRNGGVRGLCWTPRCVRHYFPGINFTLWKRNEGTCALYCEQFPRFSRLLSGLHNEGRGAAEFSSYHKLACMAPLLSPQSSSNCCNWTSPLLSSKRRCSIAYAPNTLDNESRADGLAAVLSINFNPTNCLEFISRAFETARSRGKQRNNAGKKSRGGSLMMLRGAPRALWTVVLHPPVAFEQFPQTTRVQWDCIALVNKLVS